MTRSRIHAALCLWLSAFAWVDPAAGASCTPAADSTLAFGANAQQIRGVKIEPRLMPAGNGAAGLGQARISSLRSVGFNTVRVNLDIARLIEADDDLSRKRWMAHQIEIIEDLLAAGFKVYAQYAVPLTHEALSRRVVQTDRRAWQLYVGAMVMATKELAGRFPAEALAFDLMNEPFSRDALGIDTPWERAAEQLWREARLAAPAHSLFVQGTNPRSETTISSLDPRAFDANTGFVFHAYEPGVWTHQGRDYPHLYGIPFPAHDLPGGEAAAVASMKERVSKDATLSPHERERLIAANVERIRYLFRHDGGFSQAWIDRRWQGIDAWLAANHIDSSRIFVGEFGVVGLDNFPQLGQIELGDKQSVAFERSRARFIAAIWQLIDAHCFLGGVIHQLHGDFAIGEQYSVFDYGHDVVPEIAERLRILWRADP